MRKPSKPMQSKRSMKIKIHQKIPVNLALDTKTDRRNPVVVDVKTTMLETDQTTDRTSTPTDRTGIKMRMTGLTGIKMRMTGRTVKGVTIPNLIAERMIRAKNPTSKTRNPRNRIKNLRSRIKIKVIIDRKTINQIKKITTGTIKTNLPIRI